MSVLERRLQLLLDAERYALVADEAQRTSRSVSAVIREAIDVRFSSSGDQARRAAAAQLLALSAHPGAGVGEGPAELKEAYAREIGAKGVGATVKVP